METGGEFRSVDKKDRIFIDCPFSEGLIVALGITLAAVGLGAAVLYYMVRPYLKAIGVTFPDINFPE